MIIPLPMKNERIRAGVHDGSFHPDDVVCAALLMLLYGRDRVEIVRTRDPERLRDLDYVLDVGERDLVGADRICLDHHQLDSLVRPNGIKAAACGKLADLVFADEPEKLALLRELFLDSLEAEDNGQDTDLPGHPFRFVDCMNLTWREDPALGDARFLEAAGMALRVLERLLEAAQARLEADREIRRALENGPENGLLPLDKGYPWMGPVMDYNDVHPDRKVLLMVTPDSKGRWRVQTVPVARNTFRAQMDLPEGWAGLRDGALEKACGVPGAVFCHKARFLAVFETREGAMEAARKALARQE